MKRVLIISYYWPPAGGISVIRPLKLVKYLRQSGWDPIVVVPKKPHYPIEDENLINDIPDDIELIEVPIKEPYEFYKKLTGQKHKSALVDVIQNSPKRSFLHQLSIWIRGNFFIPDARCLWIRPVLSRLKTYLKDYPVDAVFTTGPPHSVNRIGYLIKKKFNLPWVADFQDPWTQVDYYKHFKISPWAHLRHQNMERQVFENADLITTVSKSWKSDLESIGARASEIIPLGFDSDDFQIETSLDSSFTLTHLGLLGRDRNSFTLLKVIADLCAENEDFASSFRLQLVGVVNHDFKKFVMDLKLSKHVVYVGQVQRVEAIRIMKSSQLLLLLLNQAGNVSGRVPGKIFEYFGAQRPILSLGPVGTDVESMLKKSSSGINIDYDDSISLKNYFLSYFEQFCSSGIKNNASQLESYSHLSISKEFAKQIDKITAK